MATAHTWEWPIASGSPATSPSKQGISVYGLPGAPLDEPQLETIEGMAARLVKIMRTVQPVGPYRFAGWSLGGVLAYEVAIQLIGQDQIVEFAGLIDAGCPVSRSGTNPPQARNQSSQTSLLQKGRDRFFLEGG